MPLNMAEFHQRLIVCCLAFCALGTDDTKAQDYLYSNQDEQSYNPYQQPQRQFINPQDVIPFRQAPAGFHPIQQPTTYVQPDLQTSDLPVHLQHTLPQYRFTTNQPQLLNFQDNPFGRFDFANQQDPVGSPAGFRPSPQLKPTTLRPNYSHLFAKSHHNRDPSQTETFLGQITLQNPVEGPGRFDEFERNRNLPPKSKEVTSNGFGESQDDVGGRSKDNPVAAGGRAAFLNHRTRFVAPDNAHQKTTRSQVRDYFINNNGEVFITTKTPFSPKPTKASLPSSTVERKNTFRPVVKPTGKPLAFNLDKTKKGFVPKNLVHHKVSDLEPLLEEPLKDNFGTSNDDEVEVIQFRKSTGVVTTTPESKLQSKAELSTVAPANHSVEYYDDDEINTHDPNDSTDYYTDELYGSHENHKNSNDGNDIQGEDYPEEGGVALKGGDKKLEHIELAPASTPKTELESDTVRPAGDFATTTSSPNLDTTLPATSTSADVHDVVVEEKQPELVVSVVTSKTVINNTVIASATPSPMVTQAISSATASPADDTGNSTDTWVVVASVQTSRSVSGARYLPSSIVEQDVRVKLLNEHSDEENVGDVTEGYVDSEDADEVTTTEEQTTTVDTSTKTRTSTESLIDKLDRVQSDLSSGLLTGGLGNNIAVIKENHQDKVDMSSMDIKITTPSTTKAPYPQVNIRRYSPSNRPTTTKRPRPKGRKPFVDRPQSDQPAKKPDDIASLLPPGYKLNASDDKSSKLLEEILSRVKPVVKEESAGKNNSNAEISKLLPPGYKLLKSEEKTTETNVTKVEDIAKFLPPGYKLPKAEESATDGSIFKNTNADDISKFLPPGYKLPKAKETSTEGSIFKNTKADNIAEFLPPGYKMQNVEDKSTESSIFNNTKADDISKFLPPGYKMPKAEVTSTEGTIFKNTKADDIAKFLPPGYKMPKTEEASTEGNIFKNTKADDISKFLPPGYKTPKAEEKSTESSIFKNTKADDISKFLPPGFKIPKYKGTTTESSVYKNTKADDVSKFLPPGFKLPKGSIQASEKEVNAKVPSVQSQPPELESSTTSTATTAKPPGFKVVFPSRPGGGARKSSARTTPRSAVNDEPQKPQPTIHKGWPSRATTEFTGWPTPSTTPISIEKLLEAAKTASTSTANTIETTVTTTSTTTTTTTTTTPRPTTPGICTADCDLAGTIKLVGGVAWAPELLDRNTKEWQILANEVQSQLDYVYSSSSVLSKWYKKIRIDGFSEGSVLVDYLVELNELGRRVDTQEVKNLFHESLNDAAASLGNTKRGGKSLNESMKLEDGTLALGNFIVDPKYTDFLVLPKHVSPTVGYAENDVLLPQWAIAVIVIGLASLLFVIIFGVTVLVNRHKNAKKKSPTPLTEDMLNELNKSHMGGFDNYGADDLYNMEDVWNDSRGFDKPPKKRSNGSIHDNSMSNLYDSWRSEWNGYYYNGYYGNANNPGSSHSGYNGRRRSDYDTNF